MHIFWCFDEVSAIRKLKMITFSITDPQIFFLDFVIYYWKQTKNQILVYHLHHYIILCGLRLLGRVYNIRPTQGFELMSSGQLC